MTTFSTDPKKIQATITRYEKALQAEKRQYGEIHDGRGVRYLLGPLYLMQGDLQGALRSFAWFDQNFPDDMGDPGQYLCWTLALYQDGSTQKAVDKLLQTHLMNLYLIPRLLGEEEPQLDIRPHSNMDTAAYLQYIPAPFWQLWDQAALDWATEVYHSEPFQRIHGRYLEIERQLKDERPGPLRSALVREAFALREAGLG
jgi:tetratricopeptide (TPR) repeat protein